MKKILYSIFAIALVVPAMASAATFSFTPNSATFKPGQTFSTAVFVTPSVGEEITTAKLSLDFSSSLLEVVSFTPTTGWIALSLPGSDLVDNVNGKLIKTGGLPAKVTSKKQFGTIVLRAKAVGGAKIGINADSMLIDTTNTNKYIASTGANFAIIAPAPAPKPKPVITKTKVEKTPVVETTLVATEDTSEIATTTEETATTTPLITPQVQLATVSESGNGFFTVKTITISLALLLLIILGIFFWRRKSA